MSSSDTNVNVAVPWRELTLFSAYRLFLSVTLFLVFYLNLPPQILGQFDPKIYSWASQFYMLIALVLIIFTVNQWGEFKAQTTIQLLIDIVVITVLIHVSGGLITGLGSLLVVVVVAGGALIPGRIAIFVAAIAAIAVLLEVVYSQIAGDNPAKYSHGGMLGATFFVIALLTQTLSKKINSGQELAAQRQEDINKLGVLNNHIISRMQTGVLVVEPSGRVRLSNESARNLLGLNQLNMGASLEKCAPELARQLWAWTQHQANAFEPFQARDYLPQILASAMPLESGETVLYIENTSALAQQAQQLKLASLGRLTASIAHEIRNPLGAISHAGELLAEAGKGDQTTTKLTDIVLRHSARVNGIIETILQMSRRKKLNPMVVVLAIWLEEFVDEFCENKQLEHDVISLVILEPLAKVYIDVGQLHQIIWNLMDNAWHFSDPDKKMPQVEVKLSMPDSEMFIDIIDNGSGVSDKILPDLFEPFHSDRQDGTGLGLYLARELCQANGARLGYFLDQENRSCFRVSLPIDRQENLQ